MADGKILQEISATLPLIKTYWFIVVDPDTDPDHGRIGIVLPDLDLEPDRHLGSADPDPQSDSESDPDPDLDSYPYPYPFQPNGKL